MKSYSDVDLTGRKISNLSAGSATTDASNFGQLLLRSAKSMPSYVDATVSRSAWDSKLGHYNVKESNTRKLRNAIGKARAGVANYIGEIVVVGASLTSGCVDGTAASGPGGHDRLNSWPISMRDEMERNGVPAAGTGLVRTQDNSWYDPRWTFTGTWDITQKTYRFVGAAATAVFTTDRAGDTAQVRYYDYGDSGASSFSISINGATATSVPSTATAGWKYVNVTGAMKPGDKVTMTRVAGNWALVGINVYNSAKGGLLVHNIAQGGSAASGTGNANWADASAVTTLGQVFANVTTANQSPDVVMIDLGTNDLQSGGPFGGGATNATVTAAITTVRNRWPSAEVYLIGTISINPTYLTDARWTDFIGNGLYPLADTFDCPLIDVRYRFGDYAQLVAEILTSDGIGHMLAQGYQDEGRNIASVVNPKYNNPSPINQLQVGYEGNNNPVTTNPDEALLFSRKKGRVNLAMTDAYGNTTEMQNSLSSNSISRLTAVNNSGNVTLDGLAVAWIAAQSAVANASTNFFTSMVRIRSATAATAGLGCGLRSNSGQWFLSSTPNMGGFYFAAKIGYSAITATNRGFVGMSATSTALSPTTDPSALVNQIGFGFDSAHTTIRFMCNDATGTSTMVDLGANFRSQVAATDFYDFRIYAPSGNGSLVRWSAVRLNDGAYASGVATTDLPAVGTMLSAHIHHSNGTTAAAASVDINSLYIETDN